MKLRGWNFIIFNGGMIPHLCFGVAFCARRSPPEKSRVHLNILGQTYISQSLITVDGFSKERMLNTYLIWDMLRLLGL